MSERVDRIAESPTLAVTSRARAMRAAGRPVIGFGAGEPDFATPEHIVEAAAKACSDPAMHRYTPAGGLPELRTAIAEKTARDSGLEVSEDQVVVTNGGKQALFEVFQTLIDPGDEVLLPSPYWVSYPEQIRLAGGEVTVVSTSASSGFRVDLAQLEAARTSRTRALVFVSPSNPTGAVYPPDEVAAIGRWAAEHGIWVVTDEIYQHLVYGDTRFASVPVEAPETVERCVVVGGVSKTYAMTGWRVGWLIAPPAVTAGVNRLQSHLTSNVANVAQAAALAAVTGPQDEVERMRVAFDRRRRLAVERLDAARGVTCIEPQGAFYTFPSFEQALGTTVAGRRVDTTLELAEALLEVAEIAVVPGEAFGAPGYARLSYALGDEDLAEGLERLHRALDASSSGGHR